MQPTNDLTSLLWTSGGGAAMRNEPWVWPKVGDAGTSGAGAVPLRSAQMMGQQKKKKKKKSNSDRFSTYRRVKSIHVAEKYLNDITITKFRDTLIRLCFGINELKVNERYGSDNVTNKNCSFLEDESHFLLHCPVYSAIRHKYIAEFTEMPHTLNQLLETPSTFVSRKVEMYTVYALKCREKLLA